MPVASPAASRETEHMKARVPENLRNAARKSDPALENASDSFVIRVALLVLAGYAVNQAIEMQNANRRGIPLTDLGTI
jgi:uncharacterized protein (UPF0147 family)